MNTHSIPRLAAHRLAATLASLLSAYAAPLAAGLVACAVASAALVSPDWPPAPPLPSTLDSGPGELPASISAAPAGTGRWSVTFRYSPDGPAARVALAGTFNHWSRDAHVLAGPDADGRFQTTLPLGAGQHQYKFVIDGERWLPDPQNPRGASDGHGGQNSVLALGRLAGLTVSDAKKGDGRIDADAVEHDNRLPLYLQWLDGERALVRVRTLAGDVESAWAVSRGGRPVRMSPVAAGPLFAYYETTLSRAAGAALEYTFVLEDGGLRGCPPESFSASFAEDRVFRTPEWARHAIWYQIMPDRFRNGNRANDPDPVRPWTSEWFSMSPWESAGGATFYQYAVFRRLYGGDIDGLEEQLPYLKRLGVNALYLNPVFIADTHHKYNATDFLHVDPHFGVRGDYAAVAATEDLLDPKTWKWTETDRRFLRFLKAAKAQGFRVVIDGVFNHVGVDHPAFKDVRKSGKQSRFADWFIVKSWDPFDWEGWAGFKDLPAFQKTQTGLLSATLRQHIFDVTRRWMDPDGDGDPSDGVDGWRLDVPNELPLAFWAEWRTHVKSINPDAYICGEIWDRADAWLDGRHFDAVMNYQFAHAAVKWIIDRKAMKIAPSEIDRRLAELRLAYPPAATYVMQNLVDSHDTDRIASMAFNPDRPYDKLNRVQDDNPDYRNDKPDAESYQRARLVALLQATYVGAPMIYYGTEAGMWGADDPTCRKPMLWADLEPYEQPQDNHVMIEHLEHYRAIFALRSAHAALRVGTFETLLTDDAADVWAFLRVHGSERVLVALNASTKPQTVKTPVPGEGRGGWKVVFGAPAETLQPAAGDTGTLLTLTIPPLSGLVLVN